MKGLQDYLAGVRAEMTHIKWPTTVQAIGYTALVILIALFVAGLLGAFDYVFTIITQRLLGA